MYPQNNVKCTQHPEWTWVVIGSMNMGYYIYLTLPGLELNLFLPSASWFRLATVSRPNPYEICECLAVILLHPNSHTIIQFLSDKSTILEMIRTALLSHVTSDPKEGQETQDQKGDCFERISTATEKDPEPVKVEIISHKSNKHQTESHVLQTGSDGKKTVIDR